MPRAPEFVALSQRPWRRPAAAPAALPAADWVESAALLTRSAAWRAWLAGRPGGRWLLCQPDPLEFTAALLALWESGRIAVLPGDASGAAARLHATLDGELPQTPPPDAATSPPPVALLPSRVALEIHTSGSSGAPARLPKRFEQLDTELAMLAAWLGDQRWAVVSQISHQHLFGLTFGILLPLCWGAPFSGGMSRYPEILAQRLGQLAQASRPALVISSPSQLARLPGELDWPRGGARRLLSAGAALAVADARRAAALLGAEAVEIYGSSETGVIASRRPLEDPLWRPFAGVEWRLDGARLLLRSPFMPEPAAWWEQPDEVRAEGQGFHLLGRRDRVLKVAGKRVSLYALEQALSGDRRVLEARCVALGNRDGRLGMILALRGPALPWERRQRRALIAELRQRLLDSGVDRVTLPRYWRFVARLPLDLQGKLTQAVIARLFADLGDPQSPRWLGCTTTAPGRCTITLEVPERLGLLRGHFEGCPIVPGVALVDWAARWSEECFGPLGCFTALERLKFQRPLRPGMRCELELGRGADGVQFDIHSHCGRHCSGRLVFTPAPPDTHPEERRHG